MSEEIMYYRKVMCSDSEPTKNGSYKTEFGEQFFSTISGWGLPYKGHWSYSTNTNPNWWLEEIELPSEESVFPILCEAKNCDCNFCMERIHNIVGFNKAIALIKGQ